MAVNYIPNGFHTITPYLIVQDAAGLVEFVKQVFDAEVIDLVQDNGVIRHGEVRIGDSIVMVSEASDAFPAMPAMLHVYVENMDAVYRRALDAGATSVREPRDEFYGDRSGGVADKFGNQWWIATHIEDISREEIARRAQEMQEQNAG